MRRGKAVTATTPRVREQVELCIISILTLILMLWQEAILKLSEQSIIGHSDTILLHERLTFLTIAISSENILVTQS